MQRHQWYLSSRQVLKVLSVIFTWPRRSLSFVSKPLFRSEYSKLMPWCRCISAHVRSIWNRHLQFVFLYAGYLLKSLTAPNLDDGAALSHIEFIDVVLPYTWRDICVKFRSWFPKHMRLGQRLKVPWFFLKTKMRWSLNVRERYLFVSNNIGHVVITWRGEGFWLIIVTYLTSSQRRTTLRCNTCFFRSSSFHYLFIDPVTVGWFNFRSQLLTFSWYIFIIIYGHLLIWG